MEKIKALFISSADPEKISLFIKSIAAFAVLFGVDQTVVDQIGSSIADIITAGGMLLTALTALYGLFRKFKLGRWSATSYSQY